MEFFYKCGNQTAHEKWNARKWCSKTEEQKNCEIIKFDKNRCIRIILNEDTKCTAKEGRPGYEISYDWAISLMWYLMTEANSKFLKKHGELNEKKRCNLKRKANKKKRQALLNDLWWLRFLQSSHFPHRFPRFSLHQSSTYYRHTWCITCLKGSRWAQIATLHYDSLQK